MMIGQWRKCPFCKRKFRLKEIKGGLRKKYNFVIIENRVTGKREFAHERCYNIFIKTRPKESVLKFKAGFNVLGPYFEVEG